MNAVISPSGRWTRRVCERCRQPRMMPAAELVCRRCAPEGGPRSWRLAGLRRVLLEEHSAEDVAREAGVSEATLRRAEMGGRVQARTAARIAEALGTTVMELAEGESNGEE